MARALQRPVKGLVKVVNKQSSWKSTVQRKAWCTLTEAIVFGLDNRSEIHFTVPGHVTHLLQSNAHQHDVPFGKQRQLIIDIDASHSSGASATNGAVHISSPCYHTVHCHLFRRITIVVKSHSKDFTTVIYASRSLMADWKFVKTPLASGLSAIEIHLW